MTKSNINRIAPQIQHYRSTKRKALTQEVAKFMKTKTIGKLIPIKDKEWKQ